MPAEPGRLVVIALLARARRERGCSTPGDDRLETRVYAVKRYLFRLGHANGSARYATSIAQLVVGLAPVIGWGPVPRDRPARAAFVRTHRRSVQRWLDDLQAAALVVHEPERDGEGLWWRTQIVLQPTPALEAAELQRARRRARGWKHRERRRRSAARRAPSLSGIRARSAEPAARTRARLARERTFAAHERLRRAAAEGQIARAAALRSVSGDLAHPFGAPPTSALSLVSLNRCRRAVTSRSGAPTDQWAARSELEDVAVVAETGARDRAAPADVATVPAARTAGTEEVARLSREDFDALVRERLATAPRETTWRTTALREQGEARVAAVVAWPVGVRCPLGRLREAWVAHRYGLAMVVQSGTALAGWARPELARAAGGAIGLYEAHAAHRPPGWPASGAAALCVLAAQGRAERFAGDVANLERLAKGMRAVALERDAERLARARERAARRRAPRASRWRSITFRLPLARTETAEGRRRRVRDAVLLADGNPAAWPNAELALAHVSELAGRQPRLLEPDRFEELDGIGARATRYRAELARGTWPPPIGPADINDSRRDHTP